MSTSSKPPAKGEGQADSSGADGQDPRSPNATAPARPGDEAAPGTPGTGEGLCRQCGGSGKTDDGKTCPACDGTGKVTVGIGGA